MMSPNHDAGQSSMTVGYERSDDHKREIIDHAIDVQRNSNTVSALEYLKSNNIGADVIARVLLEPAKRRLRQ